MSETKESQLHPPRHFEMLLTKLQSIRNDLDVYNERLATMVDRINAPHENYPKEAEPTPAPLEEFGLYSSYQKELSRLASVAYSIEDYITMLEESI